TRTGAGSAAPMNDRDLHQRASELFLQLRLLPHDQRDRALMVTAARDEPLHREVASLLEHDDLSSVETAEGLGTSVLSTGNVDDSACEESPWSSADELP